MSHPIRILLGIALTSTLAVALALVMPDHTSDVLGWFFDDQPVIEAIDSPKAPRANSVSETDLEPRSDQSTIADNSGTAGSATSHDHVEDAASEPTTSGQEVAGSFPVAADTTDSNGGTNDSSAPTSTEEVGGQATGSITGSACPCSVSGVVELKGTVSLQGDIVVSGGTLVARPGVEVDGNGFQIMFMDGGKADFQGSKTSTWSGGGSNANLTRDITFSNMRRIMFHSGAGRSTLRFFAVRDSGTSALGDYPIHFHLNGNSTSGTIVEGVVVVNGRHHAFVPHGSHGITFRDTIAKNTAGTAYWWDPPGANESCDFQKQCTLDNSNGIVFDHALVDGVRPMPGDSGHRVAGFLLGAGKGNVVKNSSAINISGGADCAGFQWPEAANQNVGGNVWTFTNNRSSSSGCHGIFVWQNDGNHHVINGFVGSGIDHGAYSNNYEYIDVDVPYFEVHAAGVIVRNSSIDKVITRKHRNDSTPTARFSNVTIGGFSIQNAGDGGEIAGVYRLDGSGLTCDGISYDNAVPGTKVVIDGSPC